MEVTTKKRVKVPQKVKEAWARNRVHGDFNTLLTKLKESGAGVGVGERAVREALNEGKATVELQQKITAALAEMVEERRAAEKELEKQQLAALKNA